MNLKKEALINNADELMTMFIEHFEYSIANLRSYDELSLREQEIIPKYIFDEIVELPINNRKKNNLKIINRLTSIIDTFPNLRFHQLLINFKIEEKDVNKFNEESLETLTKLNNEIHKFKRDDF